MMKDVGDLDKSVKQLLLAIRQSGVVALSLQTIVQNEGKATEGFASDSDRLRKKRAAKTLVDLVVQDILFLAASETNLGCILLDAEESTPLTSAHKSSVAFDVVLIIDPIDGTLEYVEGRDNYSVCLGINRNGKISFAAVHFPARDILYFSTDGTSYRVEQFTFAGLDLMARLRPIHSAGNVVYVNRRVPAEMIALLTSAGFDVHDDEEDDIGVPDVLLRCMTGSVVCYISHTRQVRDILLGAIIQNTPNGFAVDWLGKDLNWPTTPRISRAIFGIGSCPESIVEITSRFQ